jgi:hypothetical protein
MGGGDMAHHMGPWEVVALVAFAGYFLAHIVAALAAGRI